MTPGQLEVLRPRLSEKTRALLEAHAKAVVVGGNMADRRIADAIRFLLEKEDKISAMLASGLFR